MKPMVHRLEAEYWGKVDFIYLNQYDSANQSVFSRYGMRGRPVFVLITPEGEEITKWFGSKPEAEIRQLIDEYLASL